MLHSSGSFETDRVTKKMDTKFHRLKRKGLRWREVSVDIGVEMVDKLVIPILESEAITRTLTKNEYLNNR